MGISLTLLMPEWDSVPPEALILAVCFSFVQLFGIFSGLALVEKPQLGIALSAVYQAIQIPVLSSPVLSYTYVSGLQLGAGWLEGRPAVLYEFGTRSTLFLFRRTDPWLIGVNILALALFIYLLFQLLPKSEVAASQKQPPTSSNTGQESQVEP